MVTTQLHIDIDRPLSEVFAYLMEPKNYLVWQSGLLEIKTTDGMNSGSAITFVSMGLGRRMNMKAAVTENDQRSSFTVVTKQGPISFESQFHLHSTATGTRVELSYKIDTGTVFRLAESTLQSISDSKYDADLHTLKAILEAA